MFLIFFTKPLTVLTVRLRRTLKANRSIFNDLHQVWQLQCFQNFIKKKTKPETHLLLFIQKRNGEEADDRCSAEQKYIHS